MNNNWKLCTFRNYFLKLKMPKFYYSDKIIISVNNNKNIPRLSWAKFMLSYSASAIDFATSSPILFRAKRIMTKWKNNRLIIAIESLSKQ